MSDFQSQVKISFLAIGSINGGGQFNVVEKEALEEIAIYEDIFEPSLSGKIIIRDDSDYGNSVPISAPMWLIMDIEIPDSGGQINVPMMYCYSVEEIKGKDNAGVRWWELRFSSNGFATSKWMETHLVEDFEGLISDFVKQLYEGAKNDGEGAGFEYWKGKSEESFEVEATTNNIIYKNKYVDYPSLRKDGPQNVIELINQCAENAITSSVKGEKGLAGVANFKFWQGLYGWNFKSIESLMNQEPVKEYCENIQIEDGGEGPCSLKDAQIQAPPIVIKSGNRLQLARDGMYASMFRYHPPLIDAEKYPYWMVSSIETFYYKVNCRFLDRFPAAIVGFRRSGFDIHRWHYAFVEVYLEYDYETHTPTFKIKPLSENPIRSNIKFTEEGIEEQGDAFYEPAHNTMEIGNDGYYDNGQRTGWEAPGVRLDTKMWEESCFKIQPIRGSAPWNVEGNNTTEDFEIPSDTMLGLDEVNARFPVVDMKIYKDVEGQPHYFFTAENSADGECSEADANGDCPQVPEE
jgi:hypothetical protein